MSYRLPTSCLLIWALLAPMGSVVIGEEKEQAKDSATHPAADDQQPKQISSNGLTSALPLFPPGEEVTDAVKVRYKFRVVENESTGIKIIFGWNRFRGTGNKTYLIETNLYADSLRYENDVQTTWPMQGRWTPKEASLRIAIPDYNKQGKTGAKTFSPQEFPRQTYLIDGIKDLSKTDLISQMNLNGEVVQVELARGPLIKHKQGWKQTGDLDQDEYRRWNARATIKGKTYDMAFALPEAEGKYLAAEEMLHFGSEFLHAQGRFKVHYWDTALLREGSNTWQPLTRWYVTSNDGGALNFGIRVAKIDSGHAIEFCNEEQGGYLDRASTIDLASGKFVAGNSPEKKTEDLRTMALALEKLSEKWDQPWVHTANRVVQNRNLTDQEWASFFSDYFASHTATREMWQYLWYPAFSWFDAETHRKLQAGLNEVARERVQGVLKKHPEDLEEFLADHPQDRADLEIWLAFLKKYENTRDAALKDQGNSKWVAKLITENPQWLSSTGAANSGKNPQVLWLKNHLEAIVK